MRRVVIPELLDRDAGTEQEIQASLRDLRRVNRWFGGVSTTMTMVEQVAAKAGRRRLSLLDIGAGSGDVALAVQRAMASRGILLDVTLLDRHPTHLRALPAEIAKVPRKPKNPQLSSAALREGGALTASNRPCMAAVQLRRVAADALALPFRDGSFDMAGCALLAHHLDPTELSAFMVEALRVCRIAVLINDLRRSLLSLGLVYAGLPIYRSRLTRHDAPASVRRAYTMDELRHILGSLEPQAQPANSKSVGNREVARIEIEPHYLFRMAVIAWKAGPTGLKP